MGRNGAKHLARAVGPLRHIPTDRVRIRYIDNGSTDDSVAVVRQALPHADILERGVNTGFAGGHNFGLSLCQTEFVLLQDQDVMIDWPGIEALLQAFEDPAVAAVQGKLFRERNVLDSAGIIQTITLNGRERGAGEEDRGQYEQSAAVAAVTGGCALYRMEALRAVAHGAAEVFDETFFAYKEDVDLGWRLRRAGWACVYVPVRMGWHARTMRREGVFNWGIHPRRVLQRLRTPRTRMSLRNYCWMVAKNASLGQILLHGPAIAGRLVVFAGLSVVYPPLFRVWGEVAAGLPRALARRG